MANLTASWKASSKYGNTVVVHDFHTYTGANLKPFVTDFKHGFARFLFASAPKTATDVVVLVEEVIKDLDGKVIPPRKTKEVPDGPTKEFHGRIENGKFVASLLVMGKLSDNRNNEFRLTGPEGKNTIRAFIHDPERVSSHVLTVTIRYKVDGKPETFVGTSPLHVRFPLAMVIPKGKATLDTALNMIPRYASHWQSEEPDFRHVEGVPIVVTRNIKRLEPRHFDGVVAGLRQAALNATAGVVALSVGHGGADGQAGTAFISLVPEDNRRSVTGLEAKCRVTQTDLVSFDEPPKPGSVKITPSHDTLVRLNALDRIADALANTPIRRLILHTCNAGNDGAFIQLLANRLRVPVQAQRDFIFFEPQASYYEKDGKATLPRDGKFWPIHRLGSLKIPKKTPPPRLPL
ncbi:MAG: hypothetical protein KC731_40075 [Myxococcales bacterium]|nr:hypothetical protein [Myxococcales bacterium]